jgi:hypothetical protein
MDLFLGIAVQCFPKKTIFFLLFSFKLNKKNKNRKRKEKEGQRSCEWPDVGGGRTTLGALWGWRRPPLESLGGGCGHPQCLLGVVWPPPTSVVGGQPPIRVVGNPQLLRYYYYYYYYYFKK